MHLMRVDPRQQGFEVNLKRQHRAPFGDGQVRDCRFDLMRLYRSAYGKYQRA